MGEPAKKIVLPFPALPDKTKGKDELNLAEFPLGPLTDKEDPDRHTVTFEDQIVDPRFNEPVTREVVVTSSPAYGGLPTAFDQDILLGLVNLTKTNTDFKKRKVYFTRHQLIELLDLPDKGQTYKRIAHSFHKWKSVSVHYRFSWWKRGEEDWADEGFSFIDHFKLYDNVSLRRQRQRDSGAGKQFEFPFSYFTWGESVFQSFQDEYVRTLDLQEYLALQYPTSKRIFRFLGKRSYHRRKHVFDLDVFAFQKVGLSRSYEGNAAQIKRKLLPALKELEDRGFLVPASDRERFRRIKKGQWEIVLETRKKGKLSEPTLPSEPEPSEAVSLLREFGVSPRQAKEVADQFDLPEIRERVDQLQWLLKHGHSIERPAGFLVSSLRNSFEAPPGYTSLEARREEEEQKKAHAQFETLLQAHEGAQITLGAEKYRISSGYLESESGILLPGSLSSTRRAALKRKLGELTQ